ncbi:MAG: hypothetical protein ACOCV1_00600 [Bacillota bacterium]
MIFVYIQQNTDGNLEDVRASENRLILSEIMEGWMDDNVISIHGDYVYKSEDMNGTYISRVVDENIGSAIIKEIEMEE